MAKKAKQHSRPSPRRRSSDEAPPDVREQRGTLSGLTAEAAHWSALEEITQSDALKGLGPEGRHYTWPGAQRKYEKRAGKALSESFSEYSAWGKEGVASAGALRYMGAPKKCALGLRAVCSS